MQRLLGLGYAHMHAHACTQDWCRCDELVKSWLLQLAAAPQPSTDRQTYGQRGRPAKSDFEISFQPFIWSETEKKSVMDLNYRGNVSISVEPRMLFYLLILSVRRWNVQWAICMVGHIKQENSPNACVRLFILCFLEMYFGLKRINQRFKFSMSPVGFMSDLII